MCRLRVAVIGRLLGGRPRRCEPEQCGAAGQREQHAKEELGPVANHIYCAARPARQAAREENAALGLAHVIKRRLNHDHVRLCERCECFVVRPRGCPVSEEVASFGALAEVCHFVCCRARPLRVNPLL
eukprot:scaffold70726_cov62-Phaeocystis_antarctica.AAC.4